MNHVTFSPAAVADLDDIWDYTAEQWGLTQVEHYIDSIRDACIGLASGNRQGRAVDIRDGYLKYVIKRHRVFFRTSESGISVIRVLHQSMDLDQYL